MSYLIGVDVGGTFTDAVLIDDNGRVAAAKAPSTPPDCSVGVLDVLRLLAEHIDEPLERLLADTHHVAHGTTSSLNALVTRYVPAIGFLTTVGHRDSIFIMNVEGRYLGRSPEALQSARAECCRSPRPCPRPVGKGGTPVSRPSRRVRGALPPTHQRDRQIIDLDAGRHYSCG